MTNPLAAIPFPDSRAVIADDARRFQALTPCERWRSLFELRRWGAKQRGLRVQRASAGPEDLAAEVEWQRIQKELFARHGG